MNAHGISGVEVGSYVIRIDSVLPKQKSLVVKGFSTINNIMYAISSDFNSSQKNLLKDNGMLDEDKRINVFAKTFGTLDWPVGRYYMSIFAVNRPEEGPYVYDSRHFTFEVGIGGIQLNGRKELPGIKNTIVWKKKGVYAYFPSLMKLQDLTLVTYFAIKNRQSHIDTTGKISTMISKDNGYIWTPTEEKINKNLPHDDRKFNQVKVREWKYISDSLKNKYEKMKIKTIDVKPGIIAYLSNEVFINKSLDKGCTWTLKTLNIPDDVLGLHKFGEIRLNSGLWIITLMGYLIFTR